MVTDNFFIVFNRSGNKICIFSGTNEYCSCIFSIFHTIFYKKHIKIITICLLTATFIYLL